MGIFKGLKFAFAIFLAACFSGTAVYSHDLIFEDKSGYQNFSVFVLSSGNQLVSVPRIGRSSNHIFDLDAYEVGDKIEFSIRFEKPEEQGSHSEDGSFRFQVRNVQRMQVSLKIKASQALLDEGFRIPVFYFDCIGGCGFSEIDPIPIGIAERIFERFFKAALMAEHYRLRLGNRNNPSSRRAVQLWRDGSVALGEHQFDWWCMTRDILVASVSAYGAESSRNRATEKYFSAANCS